MLGLFRTVIGWLSRVTGSEHELIGRWRDMAELSQKMTSEYAAQLETALQQIGELRSDVDGLRADRIKDKEKVAKLERRVDKSEEQERNDAAKIKVLSDENVRLKQRITELEHEIAVLKQLSSDHGKGS